MHPKYPTITNQFIYNPNYKVLVVAPHNELEPKALVSFASTDN